MLRLTQLDTMGLQVVSALTCIDCEHGVYVVEVLAMLGGAGLQMCAEEG